MSTSDLADVPGRGRRDEALRIGCRVFLCAILGGFAGAVIGILASLLILIKLPPRNVDPHGKALLAWWALRVPLGVVAGVVIGVRGALRFGRRVAYEDKDWIEFKT